MAVATLEKLVGGFYAQAAQLAAAAGSGTGVDAALALYLAKADPLMVLRDLLGHSSALTTEAYLCHLFIWLDTRRIYADAYEQAGTGASAGALVAAAREADTEFDTHTDGGDA